jgi:twitching motility protein PilJ
MQPSVANSAIQSSTSAGQTKFYPGSKRPSSLRWRSLSLRVKGTLLAVAISTIPIVVVGLVTYIELKETNRQAVEKTEQRLASYLQSQLNQFMWERFGDIQILAGLDILTDAKIRQTTTAAEKSAVLERFLKAYPIYDSVAAFDLNGDPIAQTKGERLPNFSNRSYIQEALRTKGPVLSQPIVSAVNGTSNIFSAAPLRDKDTGEIIGTIRARIPVAKLSDLIKPLESQKGTAFYLINESGKVFYGPEGIYTSQVNTVGGKVDNGDKAFKEKQIEDIFPEIQPFKASRKVGSTLSVNPTTKVQQSITYVPLTSLKGLPDLNWSVALAVDSEVAFAAQKEQLRILLIGLGLTLVIVITVSIYLINRAIRPVFESAQVVKKIGQGHLDMRVPVHGDDELAMLGTHINQMADQLQILLKTLRQNEARLKEQNDVLSDLARNEAVVQGNLKAAAGCFTEAIAKTLQLERVSIWLYSPDLSHLTCLDRYNQSLQQHSHGELIHTAAALEYFENLQSHPFVAVNNVHADSTIHPLLADGLLLSDTQALLTLPIQIANRTVGFVQCEHGQTARVWQANEQTFVTGVASLVAIVLESEFLQQEVSQLLDVVADVEEGNLTTQAQVSDRATGLVADTFNRLIERFSYVLNQVLVAAHQVSESANQQTALIETVADNADLQAQAVTRVLSLTGQVEQAAQGSAERVKISNESLQTVSNTLIQGQAAIDALTQGITVLQEGTNRIVQRMKTLGEFVGLADQFVQNQSQIAFITQTLSLNASLVAARASEQRDPRQFVVVAREFDSIADQVNKLAQQTSEGLTHLEQRSAQIHSAVASVDEDVQSMGELVRQFTTGVEQSSHVFQTVQNITGEAVQAGEAVNQFSRQIMQATQATAQVMQEITGLAHKTATLTQVARESSEQMDALAAQLLQTVQFFQLPDDPDANPMEAVQNKSPAIADITVTIPAETVPQ